MKENREESKELFSLFHDTNVQHRNSKVIYLELQYNYDYTYTYANIFNKVIYNINETKRISRTHTVLNINTEKMRSYTNNKIMISPTQLSTFFLFFFEWKYGRSCW